MAKHSGLTESAVRYYIKTHKLDRRYDIKVARIKKCRDYFRAHPNATRHKVATATQSNYTTVRQYWEYISTDKELTDFDSLKIQSHSFKICHIGALVLDFDSTLFDTTASKELRAVRGTKNWDSIYSKITEFRLYEGWRDVLDWAKSNGVKIGILSTAKAELIKKTIEYHNVKVDAVVGWQRYKKKPNIILGKMLLKRLNVREEQILYVGDSIIDEQQAQCSNFRFAAATWHSENKEEFEKLGVSILSNPREVIDLMVGTNILT